MLLGPPASGKGTQAEMLRVKSHIQTPSVGAILREEKAAGTKLGVEAAKFTDQGLLVPNEMIVELVRSWLAKHNGDFVFDGFPRTIGQAEALEQLLNERGTPLEIAITLDVDQATIRDRVGRRLVCEACGRIVSIGLQVESAQSACPQCAGKLVRRCDDTPDALKQRMAEYHEKSEPLIFFYQERGLLRHIAGARTQDEVFADVASALEHA